VEDHEARKLFRLRKAKAATAEEVTEVVSLSALKRLTKDTLIETVNREFDLNVDDSMSKSDILDLAETAMDEESAA